MIGLGLSNDVRVIFVGSDSAYKLVIMWFLKLKPTNDESAFIEPRLTQKERLGELITLRNICSPDRKICVWI